MEILRSRGYADETEPVITVQIQMAAARKDALDWNKLRRWIRKIRRRYKTDGVEYKVAVNSRQGNTDSRFLEECREKGIRWSVEHGVDYLRGNYTPGQE